MERGERERERGHIFTEIYSITRKERTKKDNVLHFIILDKAASFTPSKNDVIKKAVRI